MFLSSALYHKIILIFIPRLYISSVFFTYFLKQLKLKPKIVCYTTFNLNIGRCLISAWVCRTLPPHRSMPRRARGVQEGGVPQTMTRVECNNDWKVPIGELGACSVWCTLNWLIAFLCMCVCVFLYVCICMICFILKLDGSYPRAFWNFSFCLIFYKRDGDEWVRGRILRARVWGSFRFFKYLDGFKLIVNCQWKWFLL